MHMSFAWTPDVGEFFFKGLTINSIPSFLLLCFVLCTLSIIYEAMKIHSAQIRARAARERIQASSYAPSESANLLPIDHNRLGDIEFSKKICKPLREALIFLIHNTLGYSLMLSVMIFNGYIFLVVVFSMGLGYFIFGHISMKINMENVQARTNRVICTPPTNTTSDPNTPGPSSANSFSSGACNEEISTYQQQMTQQSSNFTRAGGVSNA